MAFAKRLSRYRHEHALDELLGNGVERGNAAQDRQIRSIVLNAHVKDGELLSHAKTDFARARRHAEAALRTLFAWYRSRESSFEAAFELAVLQLRMGVRESVDPEPDSETIVSGLRAFSADCLAVRHGNNPSDGDSADALDRGVLSFIRFLGGTRRPRMTGRQLARFVDGASRRGIQQVESIQDLDGELHSKWPPPPAWVAGEVRLGRTVVKPLLSAEDMLDWGHRAGNCLARGWYQDDASRGKLALFALHNDREPGTLSIRAVHENRNGKVRVLRWRKDLLYGPCKPDAHESPSAGRGRVARPHQRQLPHRVVARRTGPAGSGHSVAGGPPDVQQRSGRRATALEGNLRAAPASAPRPALPGGPPLQAAMSASPTCVRGDDAVTMLGTDREPSRRAGAFDLPSPRVNFRSFRPHRSNASLDTTRLRGEQLGVWPRMSHGALRLRFADAPRSLS